MPILTDRCTLSWVVDAPPKHAFSFVADTSRSMLVPFLSTQVCLSPAIPSSRAETAPAPTLLVSSMHSNLQSPTCFQIPIRPSVGATDNSHAVQITWPWQVRPLPQPVDFQARLTLFDEPRSSSSCTGYLASGSYSLRAKVIPRTENTDHEITGAPNCTAFLSAGMHIVACAFVRLPFSWRSLGLAPRGGTEVRNGNQWKW
ncbi:hypothetical protein BV22DRAFT_53075 [Leucogyrophana mollusca]|uniref:Uncharacterized protein n=1 Tax=Leucogyrophana mollusca TaxID=85980 RepID=A0ACB8BXV7_9AGAM|nr:hypothetical protein BV22DRAFT_53075 [Leucogyrophana mollusca]